MKAPLRMARKDASSGSEQVSSMMSTFADNMINASPLASRYKHATKRTCGLGERRPREGACGGGSVSPQGARKARHEHAGA